MTPRSANDVVSADSALASDVVVIGKESVGKSQLIRSLTGRAAVAARLRGTTVACDVYRRDGWSFVDTPGILLDGDSLTTRLALDRLQDGERVLLVANGTHLDEDLADLLPVVRGKHGAVAVTFWDMVGGRRDAAAALERLERAAGVRLVPVDGRQLSGDDRRDLQAALAEPRPFPAAPLAARAGWRLEPRRGLFEIPLLGPLLALLLLLGLPWVAVTGANRFADAFNAPVAALLDPLLGIVAGWPAPLAEALGGDYGFVAMGPFLLLYAVPTVTVFALLLAVYKASGLVDRLTVAIHPALRPFGLTGRDLVRVIMGFGCNVPAVINSRACSTCSRGACVSAISFGSACSYQLPATLAVFAAAGTTGLVLPYLLLLAGTTLVYMRLTVGRTARGEIGRLKLAGRDFLQWPSPAAIGRDTWDVVRQFFVLALPVFLAICVVASLLEWMGALDGLATWLAPVMAAFNLPGEAAVAVILGSIRKDGIAIGLLDSDWSALKVPLGSSVQVLTIVYLAGVLLPCLVTLLTVVREMSFSYAWRMVARQVAAAVLFSLLLAWGGASLP